MVDRRSLLLGLAALPCAQRAVAGSIPGGLFDSFAAEDLDASPEETTALGLDVGARAWARSRLDDRSPEAVARQKARIASQLARLLAFDPAALGASDRISYEMVRSVLRNADQANGRYDYGPVGFVVAGWPYVVSHLTGAYSGVPTFLDSQHRVESKEGADAYLDRLEAFAGVMDQEIEVARHDAARGCRPPAFVIGRTLEPMSALRRPAATASTLVTSLSRRAAEAALEARYAETAAKIVNAAVYPALDRQIAFMTSSLTRATSEAGVWKLPRGEDYYADSLLAWSGSTLAPREMHQIGLAFIDERLGEIDRAMRKQGLGAGSVPQRLRLMFADPRFRFPDSEKGRADLLAYLTARVTAARAKLPRYFATLPKADVVVRPVPSYMEAARPSGYYEPPSLDGARPGVFYVNLRDPAETPRWLLAANAYHQSLPGHHLKASLYQQARLPLLRKLLFYTPFMEGWSLYAEQLADEMGLYDDDPWSRIGYLLSGLRAGVALVVDTGLHSRRCSREQAIAYRVGLLGEPVSTATTEVERYCVWPGQACSYLLDLRGILDARRTAKAALGPRFDIRRFHDAILLSGPVPEPLLGEVVSAYVHRVAAR